MSVVLRETEFEPFYTFTKKKKILLKKAIDTEDVGMIRTLFAKKRIPMTMEEPVEEERMDWDENAPLHYAYDSGKTEALMAMMDCGVDPGFELHHLRTSLAEYLIRKNDLGMLERVLPYIKDPNAIRVYDMGKCHIKTTFLGLCACLGNVDAAKILMKADALMKPLSIEETLLRNEDCCGTYQGAFNIKRGHKETYCRAWNEQMLEPWQFAAFCDDPEKASFFFDFGDDGCSEGFSEMILYVHSKEILEQIQQRFPIQMKLIVDKKHQKKIVAAANTALLENTEIADLDISNLGEECLDVDEILRSYDVLKARLPRKLTLEEKRGLVKLMLQRNEEAFIEICEKEWAEETELCDISQWADSIPVSGPLQKEFVKRLERSSLRLAIHPEHPIFDERYYYFDSQSGVMRQVRCLDHVKNLSVLDRLVQVIPPEEEGKELLYFTKKVLDMGKKTAFERLKKWGLVHDGNMAKISEYIVENNLEQFYDQAIQAGEGKSNQKLYAL